MLIGVPRRQRLEAPVSGAVRERVIVFHSRCAWWLRRVFSSTWIEPRADHGATHMIRVQREKIAWWNIL